MAAPVGTAPHDNFLRIGDVISLKYLKYSAYLSSEGVLVNDLGVSSSTRGFMDHLFQVCIQLQYSASNGLEEFLNNYSGDLANISDKDTKKHYNALMRGKDNEIRMNENFMKQKTGTPVKFGEIVQLRHIKSSKFLTVINGELARDERENLAVALNDDGSMDSWIQLMPRFKINKEGDKIPNGSEVLMKVSERLGEFIHCSDKFPPRRKQREVNSSVDAQTPWRLTIFTAASDQMFRNVIDSAPKEMKERDVLVGGDLVVLRDPESQAVLMPFKEKVSSVNYKTRPGTREQTADAADDISSAGASLNSLVEISDLAQEVDDGSLGDSPVDDDARSLASDDDNVSISSAEEYFIEHGDVVLRPMEDEKLDSNAIWVIESKTIVKGGPFYSKTEPVHLRHLNSGLYMARSESSGCYDRCKLFTFIEKQTDPRTLFMLHELAPSKTGQLVNAKVVQIRQGHYYFERDNFNDRQRIYPCFGSRNQAKAVSLVITRFVPPQDADGSKAVPADDKSKSALGGPIDYRANDGGLRATPFDLYVGTATKHYFNQFLDLTVVPKGKNLTTATTVWPSGDTSDRSLFTQIIEKLILFVQGYPIILNKSTLASFIPEKSVQARRQKLFREQGVITLLLDMLTKLKPLTKLQGSPGTNPVNGVSMKSMGSMGFSNVMFSMGKGIIVECLKLLLELIRGNAQNQMFIAGHMLVILSHVIIDPLAGTVTKEMLSSNRELQETMIRFKEISIFAEQMRQQEMNSMCLQLLHACCSCQSVGIPRIQLIINQVLYEDFQDVLIQAKVDYDDQSGENYFPQSSLYLPPSHADVDNLIVLGNRILVKGLPRVNLVWSSPSNKFSAVVLFGRTEVNLEDMYRFSPQSVTKSIWTPSALSTRTAKTSSEKESRNNQVSLERKRKVADFFTMQLLLAAELCLGRNYRIISQMEGYYPYDMLVSALKYCSNEEAKAAASRLILFLYVDRDPQLDIMLPRLCRTWGEISEGSASESLINVDPASTYKFGFVQLMISEHIKEIIGSPFSTHTTAYLELLHYLVKFNFYGDIDRLRDVIDPIVHCLNRDGIAKDVPKLGIGFDDKSSASKSKTKKKPENLVVATADEPIPDPDEADASFEQNRDATVGFNLSKDEYTATSFVKGLYEQLDSNTHLMCMTVLSVFATGVSIYFTLTHVSADVEYYFKLAVFALFSLETVSRVIVHMVYLKSLLPFMSDVFNLIDCCVVALNALAFFTNFLDPVTLFSNSLRILRLIGIVRNFRMLRSMKDIVDSSLKRFQAWQEPERYRRSGEQTLKAMVEIVGIICTIQNTIQDRNISLFVKSFYDWRQGPGRSIGAEADLNEYVTKIFNDTCDRLGELCVSNDTFDSYYIDLLMYRKHELVQSSLEVLMTHHSAKKILQQNLINLQLLVSSKREAQYSKLEKMVTQMRRDVARHDVWGKLQSNDDRETNQEMLKSLAELTDTIKRRRVVLAFDEAFEPDQTLQGILRNIGCFSLCIQMLELILTIDPNDAHTPVARNTKQLVLGSNTLLYWFVVGNPTNQALAMAHLPTFISTIDTGIGSHRVITAIFKNNEQLMKYVPKQYITDFSNFICNQGKQVQYLSLLDAVVALDERSLKENQYEVIRLLSSPQNIKKVIHYFVPISHPKYAEKVKLMAPYLHRVDVEIEELPPDLAYHLQLIQLLSKCTIGVDGMTSIEAKVQSMYFFVDVIQALLDPNSMLLAKIRLGQFLYNAMIEVEMKLPSLAEADVTWKLIESTNDVFVFSRDEIRQIEKNGWEGAGSNRQRVEYMLTCANIIGGFFDLYYDPAIFRPDVGQTPGVDRVTMREPRALEIMRGLFANIKNVYEMRTPLISKAHSAILHRALVSLNKATPTPIVATVDDLHSEEAEVIEDEDGDQHTGQARHYAAFVKVLEENEDIQKSTDEELSYFIEKIENLPRKADIGDGGVRFEPLLERLVVHSKECIQVVVHGSESTKYVSESKTKTSIWIIKIFRLMIERKWGMTIFERDDDGGEEQDIAASEIMTVLTSVGAPGMCLDFIARGIDATLQAEAIKLLVALLFREGGSLEVQKSIFRHLNRPGSDLFFLHIRSMIQDLMQWHKLKGLVVLEKDEDPSLPAEIILIRFLQLTCEGHFKPNQEILRDQPLNHHSVNLLDDLVQYLHVLAGIPCRTSTTASLSVIATILEVIQGPCEKNQDHFAFNTELIEVLNRRMRSRVCGDCVAEEENELKKSAVEVFQALLEGQGQKREIYDRMLSVIHLDVIKMICEPVSGEGGDESESTEEEVDDSGGGDENEGIEDLQIECLVLMQMLVDYKPILFKELKLESVYKDRKDIACVEVFWRGQLQRRFFHVPDICGDLAKSSKDNFIFTVDRSSPENKLYGLLDGAKVLYTEIMHQQRLKEWGIAAIFSRLNQERSKLLSYFLAITINALYLGYYTTNFCTERSDHSADSQPCTNLFLAADIEIAIKALNIFMLLSSGFTLMLFLVVRVPVNYVMFLYRGRTPLQAVILSATDQMTLYYFVYVVVVIVSLFNNLLTPFLLLDIIAISTILQEVLQAAWKPRKSILMTIILTWIIIYIYGIMVFYQFAGDKINLNANNFITLWHSFAEYVRYGSFSGSIASYGDISASIVSTHYIVDVLFFLSMFVMWNIVKGITFDQFVEIREKFLARIKDTEEVCFMCGITDKVFNRALGRDTFKKHIKNEQNLWNYVYYIIALWQQDKDDDDGLEWQVRRYIDAKDLSWLPMNKAVCLMMQEDVDDELDEYLRTDLKKVEKEFDEKLAAFKENLLKAIGRVEGALTFTPEVDVKTLKSKSSSVASKVERRRSAEHLGMPHSNHPVDATKPGSRKSSAGNGSALMLGGGLESSMADEISIGEVTDADFSDSYSIVILLEQVVNLLVPKDIVGDLVCRIDCDVSTHNIKVSAYAEKTEKDFISEKLPHLGCYSVKFGHSNVHPAVLTTQSEDELIVANMDQSNKRIVFHGKLGDNIEDVTITIIFFSQPNNEGGNGICKYVASVDVPVAVLLDAAEAKCKLDVLLQQAHGLPQESAMAIISVEVIAGEFSEF